MWSISFFDNLILILSKGLISFHFAEQFPHNYHQNVSAKAKSNYDHLQQAFILFTVQVLLLTYSGDIAYPAI